MAKHKRDEDDLESSSAGQSGDIQQLSDIASADSESVEELIEEGNAFEAEAVYGVENAKDADVSEVTTHEVPEDDVPAEYLNDDDVA
jgi:N utilization substance protein A